MTELADAPAHRYRFRSVFISDIHLGSRSCKAKMLLEFLSRVDADTIYLVGDIIDGERLRQQRYWPQRHEEVLALLAKKAEEGSRIVYIPGNHDDGLRDWLHEHHISRNNHADGLSYRNFLFKQADVFADGRGERHLVIHGDQFDGLLQKGHALAWLLPLGDAAYDVMAWINRQLNRVGEKLGLPYWSFAGMVKAGVKTLISRINRIEHKLEHAASAAGACGVIFGHTHIAKEIGHENGFTIRNDGDWVDSITGCVEDEQGNLRLLDWAPVYNQYRRALKRGDASPQQAFAVLAERYGAVAQPGLSCQINVEDVSSSSRRVSSRFQEIIDLATYGPQPAPGRVVPARVSRILEGSLPS